jgi:hypothetical protein
MNAKDKKIAETLAKFGEPMGDNVWRVQGTAVIYHKTLERIAAQAKIQFDVPTVLRAEKEEAVLMVVGRIGERLEWSIGEATIGMNYRVSGKQAAYPYAMAEKRAKDRVILKLIELSGDVYSEEEADEFKDAAPRGGQQAHEQDNTPSLADEMISFINSRPSLPHLNRFLASDQFKQDFATLSQSDKDRIDDAETKRRGELEAA